MNAAEKTGAALVEAFDLTATKPVSAWPDMGCDDDDGDWCVGMAKHDWDGPYYAVAAEDIETGDLPGMYEQIAVLQGREKAEAFAAHLNALVNGGAA